MNLLINAADALEAVEGRERAILISTTPIDGGIRIVVSDTGSGMDQSTLDHAFDEFYTTKPVGKGSGLGLALCKQIVEAAGGAIRMESEVGAGTRVEIDLPLRARLQTAA